MGRYYNGDIEGKFWFGVQSSSDGVFFGAREMQSNYVQYMVDDKEMVEAGIKECIDKLGVKKELLDKFFAEHNGYNDTNITEFFADNGIRYYPDMLEWYARLELGMKIKAVMDEKGFCEFEAEM